jgi:hypothetical protein
LPFSLTASGKWLAQPPDERFRGERIARYVRVRTDNYLRSAHTRFSGGSHSMLFIVTE